MYLNNFRLDPLHYVSTPSVAFQAMLRYSGVKLELLTDINMHNMFQSSLRGGVSYVGVNHVTGYNKYLPEYDENDANSPPDSFLFYVDANNLYGTVMTEPLPMRNFRFLNRAQIDVLDFHTLSDDARTGYLIECDLIIPPILHNYFNALPLAPEQMIVGEELLSEYTRKLIETLGRTPTRKLVPNLLNKEKYVLHYRNLKFYLAHGVQLGHIHRVVSFSQAPFMKSFVDFNTERRKVATTTFEKNFWKLQVNSVYGKTIENQ